MKRLLLTLAASILALTGISQGAIVTGGIAFVGFNADGDDDLAFVALSNIAGGEVLYFNDNEWNGATIETTGAFIDSAESEFSWTAPGGGVSAGTIVTINAISATVTTSAGSVVFLNSSNRGLGNSGEGIYVFQGASNAPTSFITFIGNGTTAQAGIAGTGLVAGTTAHYFSNDEDIAVYVGTRSGQSSFANYLPLINTDASWIAQDASGDQHLDGTAPDLPFSLTPFTVVPEPSAALLLGVGALVGLIRRRRA